MNDFSHDLSIAWKEIERLRAQLAAVTAERDAALAQKDCMQVAGQKMYAVIRHTLTHMVHEGDLPELNAAIDAWKAYTP
jgi:hypothetical protein